MYTLTPGKKRFTEWTWRHVESLLNFSKIEIIQVGMNFEVRFQENPVDSRLSIITFENFCKR